MLKAQLVFAKRVKSSVIFILHLYTVKLKTTELRRLSVGRGLCVPSFSRIIYERYRS